MPKSAKRAVATGQLLLGFGVLVCVALHPGLVLKRNEGGVSNYGVHLRTVVPYSVAWCGAAVGALAGARRLPSSNPIARRRRVLLRAYAVISALVLLSTYPYQHGRLLDDLHVGVGAVMLVFQFALTVSWAARAARRWWAVLLEIAGFVINLLTAAQLIHWLFVAQVLTGVGFGVLLTWAAATSS